MQKNCKEPFGPLQFLEATWVRSSDLEPLTVNLDGTDASEVDEAVVTRIDIKVPHKALALWLEGEFATFEVCGDMEASIGDLDGAVLTASELHRKDSAIAIGTVVLDLLNGFGHSDGLDGHGMVLLGWL